jgi:Fe-S-cluster-containing hydrogenase component 2
MAIPTTRTKENAEININDELCNGCGLCVNVCSDFSLKISNKKATVAENPCFGCIGCGHCMAVCPQGAIEINGREISPGDLFDLPEKDKVSSYDQLLSLLQRRRSIRNFKDAPVDNITIQKILQASQTAPMGLPPSDVNVLVFDTKEKGRAFAGDYCEFLKSMKWFVSGWFLALMRPIWGKTNAELFKNFVRPTFNIYISHMQKGINLVNYDAPLMMYFYGSPYSDPADPIIAATYAMLAAESLGMGTCMLGAMHPMFQFGRKGKEFREKHGIKYASREGLFILFGYPKLQYQKGIRRTFASVERFGNN